VFAGNTDKDFSHFHTGHKLSLPHCFFDGLHRFFDVGYYSPAQPLRRKAGKSENPRHFIGRNLGNHGTYFCRA